MSSRTSCIVTKLNSICKDKEFRKCLEEVVDKMSRLGMEAYQFLNFHICRLLEQKQDVSNILNQTFLRHVLVAVTHESVLLDNQESKEIADVRRQLPDLKKTMLHSRQSLKALSSTVEEEWMEAQKHISLWTAAQLKVDKYELKLSCVLWLDKRKHLLGVCPLVDTTGISHFLTTMSKHMLVACQNHLQLGFVRRLLSYISAKYPEVYKTPKQSWHLLFKLFPSHSKKSTSHSTETKEYPTLPEQELDRFLKWLLYFPDAKNIEAHPQHFISLMYDMLLERKTTIDNSRFPSFTMMPLQKGFQLKHVEMDSQSFAQLLQITLKKRRRKKPGFSYVINKMKFESFTWERFKPYKDLIWKRFFQVEPLSTANRKFAFCLSTDGYACSLHFERPESKPPFPIHQKRKRSCLSENAQQPEEDLYPQDWDNYTFHNSEELYKQYPIPSTQFSRLVAIDPGARDLFNAIDQDGTFIRATNNEYRHISNQNKHRFWMDNLVANSPRYAQLIAKLPSLKETKSANEFLTDCMSILRHREYLFNFCKRKPFRKWRFEMAVLKKKAIETFCKRITLDVPKDKVLVGMGDWNGDQSIIKGQSRAPVLTLKRALLEHASVVRVWEYSTSKACHACGSRCEKAILSTHPSKSQLKKYAKKANSIQKPLLHCLPPTTEIKSNYKILCCSNNKCRIRYKHRDRNSARNLMMCLECITTGKPRPTHLCPLSISSELRSRKKLKENTI